MMDELINDVETDKKIYFTKTVLGKFVCSCCGEEKESDEEFNIVVSKKQTTRTGDSVCHDCLLKIWETLIKTTKENLWHLQ